jgi:hypothetical protein
MLRLKMWARIGLVALFVVTSTAWVTVQVTPANASSSGGSKTVDPGTDPGTGGGMNSGDPDGPTGDIGPSGGAIRTTYGSFGGANASSVQSPVVGVAGPAQRLPLLASFKLALGYWLRAAFLHL